MCIIIVFYERFCTLLLYYVNQDRISVEYKAEGMLLVITYKLLLLSFDPANRYGKRRQSYFSGACGGRQTGTGSHLGHQRPPCTYIERSVYDRVHTRIGACKHEESVLYLLIDHLRRLVVRPVPVQQK